MLIRSQDRDKIINLQNVGSISIRFISENGYAIDTMFPGKTGETIAHYFSKEKAIKVLDRIQAEYENSLYCDHAFDNAAQVQRPYIFVANKVFQMPQDSEVQP